MGFADSLRRLTRRLSRSDVIQRARRFAGDTRGMAAVEFSVLASALTVALLGGAELSRYTLLHQKMDRVSSSVSNMVAQAATMSATDLTNMWEASKQIAKPFTLEATGKVIISFITAETASTYRVTWQRSGAGTLAQTSKIGTQGGVATLPSGVTLAKGDTLVAVEVYAQYEAFLVPELIGTSIIYHASFDVPRLSDTITLE